MSESADSLVIGGRYDLGDCIGQGGMGRVFRGRDRLTGASVAIKQLRPEAAARNARNVERFRREGEVLQRLNHPNIVRMIAVANQADRDYLIMEFVSGGSLDEALKSAVVPLPIGRVLNIALDLCDALIRTHRLGIIHRDLKPSNVLLAEDGTPRLTDFGAAHLDDTNRLTDSHGLIGTTEYLSPEALRGEELDARTDVWAFGVLLFEMLTRKRPFTDHNIAQTFHNIAFSPPPALEHLRPDCPVALADLVHRMLAKDREQRVPSVRQVAAELENILHGRARTVGEGAWRSAGIGVAAEILHNNLPVETATFVGRNCELTELESCFERDGARLVTIVASGGMGKTRLALELGRRLLASAAMGREPLTRRFEHGVFLVALSSLGLPDFIVSAVGEAVGYQFYPGIDARKQLFDHLRDKKLLLVMDNFEHLLEGATVIDELLRAAPGVAVLATSRERLNLVGETLFALSGMGVPEPTDVLDATEFDAIRLFVQGARRVNADFELRGADAADVGQICRLVQGAPLGIVLAASWAASLSVREIVHEISTGLDFLAGELRDLPERQRSMRAVFDHSWALMTEAHRELMARLSVFRGGFTREAAEVVAGATVHGLAALINKSLLRRDASTGRYHAHELLRQYAEQKLKTSSCDYELAQSAHAAHFAHFLSTRAAALKSGKPNAAMAEIEAELDNVRMAWTHSSSRCDLAVVGLSLDALYLFHTRRASFGEADVALLGLVEALRATHTCTEGEPLRLLGRALSLRGALFRRQGRYAPAEALLSESLLLLTDARHARERAFALVTYGSTMAKVRRVQDGRASAEEGVRLYRLTDDLWGLATALETLGRLYVTAGDFAKAEEAYSESAQIQRNTGMLPSALMGLGIVAAQQGRYAEGCETMRAALALFDNAGDVWNRMRCQSSLANAERNLGHYDTAESLARACLAFNRDVGNWDHEAWSYFQLGNILKEQGRYEDAAAQFQAAHELSLAAGDTAKIALANLEFGDLALIRGDYAESQRHLAASLTGFESSGQAWGVALALDHLGYLACQREEFDLAQTCFEEAYEIAMARKLYPFATNTAAGLALLQARRGNHERAVELLGMTQYHPATERHTLTRRIEPLTAELHEILPPDEFRAAVERGKSQQLDSALMNRNLERARS